VESAPDLAAVIAGWFKAAEQGDVSWRDQHVSREPGLRIVGTDPQEFLQGEEAYAFLKNEAETVGGRATVEVGEVEAYREGDVGWGVARPVITLMDGTNVSPRWSAVFNRKNGV
jgi:hypothetical protein